MHRKEQVDSKCGVDQDLEDVDSPCPRTVILECLAGVHGEENLGVLRCASANRGREWATPNFADKEFSGIFDDIHDLRRGSERSLLRRAEEMETVVKKKSN
jgi:hypothetical protein